MQRAKCEAYALRCVELSAKLSSPEERVKLLQMAQAWRRLAEQVEEVTGLVDKGREMGFIPAKSAMS
ncbi:MAG: hypothetical protein ACJ8F3_17110 [Xanthobacteraceae bacterium]